MTLEDRFYKYVAPMMDDRGCWEWLGALTSSHVGSTHRYGVIGLGGRGLGNIRANRFSLELKLGRKLLATEKACHTCDNTSCVNPTHLYAGSDHDNMQDCIRRGRHKTRRGELNARHKLTEEDVRAIRASTLSQRRIAAMYGVSKTTVKYILKGTKWKHVR